MKNQLQQQPIESVQDVASGDGATGLVRRSFVSVLRTGATSCAATHEEEVTTKRLPRFKFIFSTYRTQDRLYISYTVRAFGPRSTRGTLVYGDSVHRAKSLSEHRSAKRHALAVCQALNTGQYWEFATEGIT